MALDKAEYCIVDECNNYGDRAHLITRATLPKKQWDNPYYYIYLCRSHHSEQHKIGITTFCEKYGLKAYLDKARVVYAQDNESKD